MKFKGTGIVWDKDRKKRLCEFVNGIAEVDERAGKILTAQGFAQISIDQDYTNTNSEDQEIDEEKDPITEGSEIPTDWKKLQKLAAELGIPVRGKNKKILTQLVKEKLEG
jgi:hypothetical protein